MVDETESCKQKLEELVVATSIYNTLNELTPAELLTGVQALCEGDVDAAYVIAAANAGCSCSGVLQLTADAPDDTHQLSASLVFTMPPDYPEAAALQCHVTSAGLPRGEVDRLSQLLQQQATAAQGCACLYDVAAALQLELDQLQQQEVAQRQQQQLAADQLQQQQDTGSSFRRVLLRLDHMRDRQGYTSLIKQWVAELQLTGWLLFWRSLILILLEGSSRDISSYLRQARTVCVDVDANGRKCRERMLSILQDSAADATAAAAAASAPNGSSAAGGGCGGSIAPAADRGLDSQRCYTGFSELQPDSLEDVVRHLAPTHPEFDGQAVRQMLGLA